MITIRKSADRGIGRHGWLTTKHTFSFARYYDPKFMGFRSLRVINEDVVEAGKGFGAHSHDNMEIISMVMEGALAHRDSSGGDGVLRRGEVQHMSAGTGVTHSEFNGSQTEPVHFFQIWIMPDQENIAPGYEQKLFPEEERRGRLQLVAGPDGTNGELKIHQDARLYTSILAKDEKVEHPLAEGRASWIQVARGAVTVNGTKLETGDGAAIEEETLLTIAGAADGSEFLLFDLA